MKSELSFQILTLLKKEGVVSTKALSSALMVPSATVFRALDALTKEGRIVQIGKGRSTRYILQIGTTLQNLERKKERLDASRPFPEEVVKSIDQTLVKKFIQSSSAIEGIHITLRETDLVLSGLSIKGKDLEIKNIQGQKRAIDLISAFAKSNEALTEEFILTLHKEITSDVFDIFLRGKYRDNEVGIQGSEKIFPSPSQVKVQMKELVVKVNMMMEKQYKAPLIASYLHYHITAIHPFFDGNGRTARILMNAILLRYHYPIAIIPFTKRSTYYEMLKHADNGNTELFDAFLFWTMEQSIELYLRILEE